MNDRTFSSLQFIIIIIIIIIFFCSVLSLKYWLTGRKASSYCPTCLRTYRGRNCTKFCFLSELFRVASLGHADTTFNVCTYYSLQISVHIKPLDPNTVPCRAQELCEVKVAVLGSPSLIVLMASVDVKH